MVVVVMVVVVVVVVVVVMVVVVVQLERNKLVCVQVDELKNREERRLATRVSSLRSQLLGQVLFST